MRIIADTLVVREEDARPNGEPDECFYCKTPVGYPHKIGCVIVSKHVKVRFTMEYDIEVPADWTKDMIEFARNDGSWCVNNIIDELTVLAEKERAGGEYFGCLCDPQFKSHFEYIEDKI